MAKHNFKDEEEKENKDVEATENKDAETNDNDKNESDTNESKNNNNTDIDNEVGTENKNVENEGKTFTQEQVNKMMANEKRQGKNSAYRELNLDPNNKKMVELIKTLLADQIDIEETEKANEADTKVIELQERALKAEIKAEALQQGAQTNFVDDLVTLVLAKYTEDAEISTIVGEVKQKYSVWFDKLSAETEEEARKNTGKKGTGSSVHAEQKKNGTGSTLGSRLAGQKKQANKTTSKSYWDN